MIVKLAVWKNKSAIDLVSCHLRHASNAACILLSGTHSNRFASHVQLNSLIMPKSTAFLSSRCLLSTCSSLRQTHTPDSTKSKPTFLQQPDNVISEELKKVMEKTFVQNEASSEAEKAAANVGADQDPNQKKTGTFSIFTSARAWKIYLYALAGAISFSSFYMLVTWGSPKYDENNQPVGTYILEIEIIQSY